jgi:hypothetical protein
VAIAPDGSAAALVPAGRAMSWQLTNNAAPVVRERYWLSFQAGEVRVCASCHGINQKSQLGTAEAQNPPEGLRQLLRLWKANMQTPAEDRVFAWAERQFAANLLPKNSTSMTAAGYRLRYYANSGEFLGVKDGRLYYFKPGAMGAALDVGALQDYLQQAAGAGF